MTRVSLNTSTSPARSSSGRSRTPRSRQAVAARPAAAARRRAGEPGAARSGRAEGRSRKGRRALRPQRWASLARTRLRRGSRRGLRRSRIGRAAGPRRRQRRRRPGRLAASLRSWRRHRGHGADDLRRLGRRLAALDRVDRRPCPRSRGRSRCIYGRAPNVGPNMMKNWLLALFGSVGARPSTPRRAVRQVVEFGLQVGKVRSALAGALGIAALGHEAGDHAVEDEAVVEALAWSSCLIR